MKLSRLLCALLTGLAVVLNPAVGQAAPAAKPPTAVSWVFHTAHDASGSPHTDVLLRVGSRAVPVRSRVNAQFTSVARRDYHDYAVPTNAVAACTGWWAGQGEDLYAVRRAGHMVVFRRETDEQEATPPYRQYKVVALR